MPRSARTRRPARPDIRAALLAAAAQVVAERGFDAASVELIAGRAGYSTGAIYSNFAGKDDLFAAVLEERMAGRMESIRQAIEASADVDASVEQGTAEFMGVLRDDRDWFRLLLEFWAQAARRPEFRGRFAEHHAAAQAALAELLDATAARLGVELGMSPDDAALALKALSNGLALERLLDDDAVPDDLFARVLGLLVLGASVESRGAS